MLADVTISDLSALITLGVAGIISIIGAVVAGVIKIRNNQKEQDKKIDLIHESTNSHHTEMKQQIAALEARLDDRNLTISDQKLELAKLQNPVLPSSFAPAVSAEPVKVAVVPDPENPVPVVPVKGKV